jgi:hemoglobin-like flavoprotein
MGLLVHGLRMIEMLDSVLNLLGPDMDDLEQVLSGMGKRHAKMGVRKEHMESFGLAVRDALAEIMEDEWTDAMEDAWIEVLECLTDILIQDMEG